MKDQSIKVLKYKRSDLTSEELTRSTANILHLPAKEHLSKSATNKPD
jgi:hypothetical protein